MNRRPALALLLLAACSAAEPRRGELLSQAEEELLAERYATAAGKYEQFLEANPGYPDRAEVLARIGRCLLGAGRLPEAVRRFDEAAAADPEPPLKWEIAFRRAVALRLQGNYAGAVEGFRQVAAAPSSERGRAVVADELRYEHGAALCRAGDWKAGKRELEAVSVHGPCGAKAQIVRDLPAFAVQVGAFESAGGARAQEGKLRALSLPCAVKEIRADRAFHVVSTGAFARFDDAQREAERLRRLGFPDAFVIP